MKEKETHLSVGATSSSARVSRQSGCARGGGVQTVDFVPCFRTRILKRPGDPSTRFRRGFSHTVKNVDPPILVLLKALFDRPTKAARQGLSLEHTATSFWGSSVRSHCTGCRVHGGKCRSVCRVDALSIVRNKPTMARKKNKPTMARKKAFENSSPHDTLLIGLPPAIHSYPSGASTYL